MRKLVLFAIPLGLAFAQTDKPASSGKNSKSSAQQKQTQAAQSSATTIPPDAVQIGPQAYRYKDANGKSWIYRQTPFGISKFEERADAPSVSPMQQQAPAPASPNSEIKVKATDRGDSVRFEQQTPMGNRVWETKKAELTAEEKRWLEQSKNAPKDSTKPEK